MKKSVLTCLGVCTGLAVFGGAPASAAQYIFSFATNQALFGGPVMGSGTFTTSDTAMTIGGRTAFAITGIDGTFNGSQITTPTLASGFGNYFTTGPTFLDGSGVKFNTTTTTNVQFFFQDSVQRYRVNAINQGRSSYVTATSSLVAAVPEPGIWAMMVLGFGTLGFALRRARKTTPKLSFA